MKVYLPSLASFLTILTIFGFAAAQNKQLADYCKECLRKSATSGLYPHPNRCDAYVHCDVLEKKFRAFEMMCSPGLFFDQRIGNCNWESAVPCDKDCKKRSVIKDAFSCNGFFECINGQRSSTLKVCPNQQKFDEDMSKCVPDPNCPPQKKNVKCFSKFKIHPTNPNKFYQATASGWIEQRCAVGTGFNMTTCTCSNKLAVNNKHVCELVNLPMVSNMVEQSNGWYVNSKDISIQNQAAEFKSGSYVIVPVITNNDFKDHISISLSFYLGNVRDANVAVLGNSECEIPPTFSISVRNANSNSPEVLGRFVIEYKRNAIPVEISTGITRNTWVNVKLIKKNEFVRMIVNNNLIEEKMVPGVVKKQDCALTLGQSFKMGNFVGFIKNVEINKCPP